MWLATLGAIVGLVGSVVPSGVAHQADNAPKGYIVVFQDQAGDTDSVIQDVSKKHRVDVDQSYHSVVKGFSAQMTPNQLKAVGQDSRVKFISEDRTVQATAQTLPTGVDRTNAELNSAQSGTGVSVAVIDTGIDLTHPDLKNHIVAQKNCVSKAKTASANDDNGHGSHVAGTIGALNNTTGVVGMAPMVNLVAVKVLDARGSGSWSSVICGIDWVTQNATKYGIKVANMSLGGSGTSDNACGSRNADALHQAICRSVTAGVTYVVAAGNDHDLVSNHVPASYDDAVITVSALADSDGKPGGLGATTGYGADDTFATFSNYGPGVDIGAPGVNIYSTWQRGGYNTISGTSMATPHVAGAAAMYIQSHPDSTWTQVRSGLIAAGESLGSGHIDPSGLHPEPVLNAQLF